MCRFTHAFTFYVLLTLSKLRISAVADAASRAKSKPSVPYIMLALLVVSYFGTQHVVSDYSYPERHGRIQMSE